MEEIYYKCTLLTDVVLSASLATEGNLASLDYIPGSNFLGIVAGVLYPKIDTDKAYKLFHSDKVLFGDATISKNDAISYAMPFSLFMDKEKNKIGENSIYLHHVIDYENNPPMMDNRKLQLKQMRTGFVMANGKIIKSVTKTKTLKSAQDREFRTSKGSAMFGFEGLEAGQEFVFSIVYNDKSLIQEVEDALLGTKRLGKSKTAEFGQVRIEKSVQKEEIKSFDFKDNGFVLVYAQSNLCFIDDNGMPTFQPSVKDLGFKTGEINWSKSQVRTHTYSSWNGQRNTPNTQRDCIAKGSVFYVATTEKRTNTNIVGEYLNEGFGKVIYNPCFLEGKDLPPNKDGKYAEAFFTFSVVNKDELKSELFYQKSEKNLNPKLVSFLKVKKENKEADRVLSKRIHDSVQNKKSLAKEISSSQWGRIRAEATNPANKNLYDKLFEGWQEKDKEKRKGILTYGIAYEKQWSKSNPKHLENFEKLFKEAEESKNQNQFTAKFAAEMAKENRREKNKGEK